MNLPLSTAFTESHRFWVVGFSFSSFFSFFFFTFSFSLSFFFFFCQSNATPPLFTGPQVPVRHLNLEGTGRKKMALKTLPTHHPEQDPLGSLVSSGQPHAPS